TTTSRLPLREVAPGLHHVPASSFHRLTEREFGMPGLVAIESVGPFIDLVKLGPFITIHDSWLAPGLGIGHHPHRTNERLFYILQGEIRHDDAQNGITGVMNEGDLARLTEGVRGMLHKEWNGRDDIATHAFILVYTPDTEPPIELAAFDAHRAADIPRVAEAPGVETLQLIGGSADFRANSSQLTHFFDSALAPGGSLAAAMPPDEGLILYPIEGRVRVEADGGSVTLRAAGEVHPEGPDGMAIAWSAVEPRVVTVSALDGPARLLRIGFARREHDVLLQRLHG
ncbi:MAG TPA: pirin family protein, partial [Candidatus Limnocylindrales bacterium]|nr:pirin family protein [Candidatus Limnocylindrales bacterium]